MLLSHPSGMSVELLDSMGGDIDIINAARVSYGQEKAYEQWRIHPVTKEFQRYDPTTIGHEDSFSALPEWNQWQPCLDNRDAGLLNYLLRERHGTPFEMVQLKFRVKAPIGVIWEWVRHRIASYNIMSTRYVEWDKDYYIPEAEDWRQQIGKTGHYEFATLGSLVAQQVYVEAMEAAFRYYGLLVGEGLAKEVARNVLPMGSMTQMIWSVNLRSLFNFLSLRTAPNALREIQVCARMVEALTETVVPEALQIWRRHGKGTP